MWRHVIPLLFKSKWEHKCLQQIKLLTHKTLWQKLKHFISGLVYILPNLRDFELHKTLFVGSGAKEISAWKELLESFIMNSHVQPSVNMSLLIGCWTISCQINNLVKNETPFDLVTLLQRTHSTLFNAPLFEKRR